MKYQLLIILSLLVSGCASIPRQATEPPSNQQTIVNQHNQGSLIAAELLRPDLDYMVARLNDIHPAPYHQISKALFEDKVNQLFASLRYPLTRREFYVKLAPLLAQLKDSHTYLEFPLDEIDKHYFPLAVTIEQESPTGLTANLSDDLSSASVAEPSLARLFVAADLSGLRQVPVGAELIRINNAPVSYLLSRMGTLVSAETEAGKRRYIQLNFFRLMSLLGYSNSDYSLTYLWQGIRVDKTVTALDLPQAESQANSYYGFSELTESTSLLWLNDFNEDPEKFAQFLSKSFDSFENKQMRNLIIDLRFNQGGISQNMSTLLRYLTLTPIDWQKHSEMRVSKRLKQNYFDQTKNLRQNHLLWGLKWLPLEWTDQMQRELFWADPGQLVTMQLAAIEPQEEHNLKALGANIWIVTNGYCYSACALTAAVSKHYRLAKVIGENTGARVERQFAYPIVVRLPHSGLSMRVATTVIETQLKNSDAQPDENIERSRSDIVGRNDRLLNQALREAELGL